MHPITAVGMAFSVGALFLLLGLLHHWWRSRAALAREANRSRRLLRHAWPLVLVGGFLLGVLHGLPVVERNERSGAALISAGESLAETQASVLRLPFYVEEASVHLGFDGGLLAGGARRERLQVPWPFLTVAALYLFGVVRPLRRRGGLAS